MFKVMFVLHEREGIARADALRYWRETHGPIAAGIPGCRGYVQSHAVAAPEGEPPFLGIAELRFDDEGAFGAAAQSAEFGAAIADLPNFCDADRLPTAFVEDHVIV
jgi:uncharacterized protein (TIGR02118 family)